MMSLKRFSKYLIFVLAAILLSSCDLASLIATPTATPIPATPTPVPTITPTPVPAAAVVNGERIPLADYEAEVGRLQSADTELGQSTDAAAQRTQVLDEMIDETLLSQGAAKAGYEVDDAGVKERLDKLVTELGGLPALEQWQTAHGYTAESFQQALKQQMAVAWMRDKIAADLPSAIEQAHIIQILLYDEETAQKAMESVKAGSDFATLAKTYDPVTKGDLGWFPKGYLLIPEVDTAAFSLPVGQVSDIIKSNIGYHIIQVVGRDSKQPFTVDVRLFLQRQAVKEWLENQRKSSDIELLVKE